MAVVLRGRGLLMAILAGCSIAPAGETVVSAQPERSPPRVVPLPDEYRRVYHEGSNDYFCLGETVLLHGEQWAVAEVKHFDNPDALVGGPCGTFPGRAISVGWLAIELGTGRTIFLKPPSDRRMPKDVTLGRMGFHDRLCQWQAGSCAVGVRIADDDRIKNATPQSSINELGQQALYRGDERWLLWEWRPEAGSIKRLDWYAPVHGLTRALEGTPFAVHSWTPPFTGSGWHGQIRLKNRETGEDFKLAPQNANKPNKGKSSFLDHVDARLDFGPTDNNHSIIMVDHLGLDGDGPVLLAMDLAGRSRILWQHDRRAIEKQLGGPVNTVYLIPGTRRPCRHLPIILVAKSEQKVSDRPLWILDSQTGTLTGPRTLRWNFDGILFEYSFEGMSLCANHDGRLMSYCTDGSLDLKPSQVIVYDTIRGKTVASREPASPDVRPIGFDQAGNVILASGTEIFRWRTPYDAEWGVIFSLEQDGKHQAAGGPPRR